MVLAQLLRVIIVTYLEKYLPFRQKGISFFCFVFFFFLFYMNKNVFHSSQRLASILDRATYGLGGENILIGTNFSNFVQ